MSRWEPYFRPSTRVHDSGFRCFECGYLVVGDDKKAAKKVVIARSVDHIENETPFLDGGATLLHMDLLRDGNIRIFNLRQPLYWYIPGFSDATITPENKDPFHSYDELDNLYEEQKAVYEERKAERESK